MSRDQNVELNKSSEGGGAGEGDVRGGEYLSLREQQVQRMEGKPEGSGGNKLSAFKREENGLNKEQEGLSSER